MNRRRRPARSVPFVAIVAAVLIAFGLPVVRAQRSTTQDSPNIEWFRGRAVVPGEVLVAFRRTPHLPSLRAEIDTDADEVVGSGRLWRAHARNRNVESLIAHLRAHGDVLYVEPNYIVTATTEPDDPRFPELWGLRNIGQTINGIAGVPGADIKAVDAWGTASGSRATVVGIVDTGIDYTHPDLAANIWSAPAAYTVTVGGSAITCPAGSHGFNALARSCDPFDDHFHGTHVAGTIGAIGNNGSGVAGINWSASMMGLKFLGATGSGTLANAINAIEFAIQAKAAFPSGGANVRVLSNSWAGGGFSQALLDAINRANQSDMLFVAAAGNSANDNDTLPTYPASYAAANIVAVAALDNRDALATFSSYGANSVHLGAPGVQILSTMPAGAYGYLSGTSMATPHVSGAAALLLSRCTADTSTVKSMLLNNVDQIPALSGLTITGGRLNLGRAMQACGPPGNTPPTVTMTAPLDSTTVSAPASVLLKADAFDAQGAVTVAFYAGTALIGTATAAPFELTWSNASVGDYALSAVATDIDGATSTSAAVNIRVLPGGLPFGGTAAAIPGIVEAENFNDGADGVAYHDSTPGNAGGQYRQTNVDIGMSQDTDGGYSLGWVRSGEWLAYQVNATATATYTLDARVASAVPGGAFHVEVDGTDMTGRMVVPNTGGWNTWQTISHTGIPLTAGTHTFRLAIDSNGASGYLGNLNYLRLTAPGINAAPSVRLTAPAADASFVAPASVALSAAASDVDGSVTQVAFYAGSTLLGTDATAPYALSWTSVPPGDYVLTAIATDDGGAQTTSGLVTIHVVPPPPSTPFNGTAAAIPGRIEAENFDQGGEGIAYHDLTKGNAGGQYRSTDVDIVVSSDVSGGYALGSVMAGEWLKYTVSIAAATNYTLDARVSSAGTGGTFHIEVDGADASGPLAVPSTGSYQSFVMITRDIPLPAGVHVLRVVIDANGSSGYLGNINYLRWTLPGVPLPPSIPFGGVAAPIPGRIEAENFDEGDEGVTYHDSTRGNSGGLYRPTDVDIVTAADGAAGYALGYVVAGEWLQYSVVVAATGSYRLEARVSSLGAGGAFHIEVDGLNATGSIAVPNTGGWQSWQTIAKDAIPLTAGPHVLRVVIETNGGSGSFGNLNYLRWIATP